jgi:hypothetical protein
VSAARQERMTKLTSLRRRAMQITQRVRSPAARRAADLVLCEVVLQERGHGVRLLRPRAPALRTPSLSQTQYATGRCVGPMPFCARATCAFGHAAHESGARLPTSSWASVTAMGIVGAVLPTT